VHQQILVLFGIASRIAMSLEDLLIAIIIAGAGLSGAYLRAELVLHRRLTGALRRREVLQYKLHIKRVRPKQNDMPTQPRTYPSPIRLNISPVMRVLTGPLRLSVQDREIRATTRSILAGTLHTVEANRYQLVSSAPQKDGLTWTIS
jgi:hypothetical protein